MTIQVQDPLRTLNRQTTKEILHDVKMLKPQNETILKVARENADSLT